MKWFFDRYLTLGDIKPNATIMLRDNKQFRRYMNLGYASVLADDASNRTTSTPLLVNLYAAITNYFMEKVWDTLPTGEGVNSNFIQEFKKATFYRSLYGYGVVARIGERWQAIDSRMYWDLLRRGEKVGGALVVPYKSESTKGQEFFNQQANALGNVIPDRVWTVELLDTMQTALIRDFEYSGITLGRELGRSKQEQIRIVSFGNGVSDYDQVAPVVEKFDSLIRGTSDILERHSKPHMQVPVSAVDWDDNRNPGLTLDEDGAILPVNRDDKDWKYITLSSDVGLTEFQARMLLGVMSAIAAVPMATFNIHGLPRLESGEGVQALESPSNSKVESWRLDMIQAVERIGFNIDWTEEQENGSDGPGNTSED